MSGPLDIPIHRLVDPALRPIAEKLAAGVRLDDADGLTLFESPDLLGVGALADAVNRAKHGDRGPMLGATPVKYRNSRLKCDWS